MPKKISFLLLCLTTFITIGANPVGATNLRWGAYAGWRTSDQANFEQQVGKPSNIDAVFVHWGNENEFPTEMANWAKQKGQTLQIFWEAMDYNMANPILDERFNYDQILGGRYDDYLRSFALAAKDSGVEVILIPFEEMNGNWYPWAVTLNGNTPQKHIDAYRYVRRFFTNISNVKFGWAINSASVPNTIQNDPMSYYPGDEYVDFVGVNGFNFDDPWQTFTGVFDKPLNNLKAINKPAMIFSMASAEGSNKAAWIKDASEKMGNYTNLIGWVWFNENKERDWRVWSDPQSLVAFQNYLISGGTVGPTTIPTVEPTVTPTRVPVTITPTQIPTMAPTPTKITTVIPTQVPTTRPIVTPTNVPTTTVIPIQKVTPTPTKRRHKRIKVNYQSNRNGFGFLGINW
jgi:hypothetical protein